MHLMLLFKCRGRNSQYWEHVVHGREGLMQLGRSEFLMQRQSNNSRNVSLNGQMNNSGEIKIIHCVNTAGWAVNRTHFHEKETNLNPKSINRVLSRRCTAVYLLQLAAPVRWKGSSVPEWQSRRISICFLFPAEAGAACFFSWSWLHAMAVFIAFTAHRC